MAAKYKNKKITLDGITFDSKKEAARWQSLKLLERAGEISELRRQVVFVLERAAVLDGRTKPEIKFIADFVYRKTATGEKVVEDAKSPITRKCPAYRIKRHLMVTRYCIDVKEV